MMAIARRSLTDPPGLNDSAFAYRRTFDGAMRCRRMTGVRPIVSRMLSWMAMGALVGVEVRIVDCKWAGGRAGMVPAGAFEQREGRDPAAAGGMRDRRQLA